MKIPYGTSASLGKEFIDLGPDIAAAILITIATGWKYACECDDVNALAGEVTITERLRDGMRNALKVRGYQWNRSMIILSGTESRSEAKVIIPDGRTDIPLMLIEIFLRTQDHNPHAIIECKRIAVNNSRLCREYVVEGIDRFCTGKYGLRHRRDFMIGYVIAGTEEEAIGKVNALLVRNKRGEETLKLSNIGIKCWESAHKRDRANNYIQLFHSLLRFG